MKAALQQIASADTERPATARRDTFARTFRRQHPKAVERLQRDWERMTAYYAFPRDHWTHLLTTNVIESPLAVVRLRTSAAKRFKKMENATALIWKTLLVVEQHFRKLNALTSAPPCTMALPTATASAPSPRPESCAPPDPDYTLTDKSPLMRAVSASRRTTIGLPLRSPEAEREASHPDRGMLPRARLCCGENATVEPSCSPAS